MSMTETKRQGKVRKKPGRASKTTWQKATDQTLKDHDKALRRLAKL